MPMLNRQLTAKAPIASLRLRRWAGVGVSGSSSGAGVVFNTAGSRIRSASA